MQIHSSIFDEPQGAVAQRSSGSIEKLHLGHVKRSLSRGAQEGFTALATMGHALHLGHDLRTVSASGAARFAIHFARAAAAYATPPRYAAGVRVRIQLGKGAPSRCLPPTSAAAQAIAAPSKRAAATEKARITELRRDLAIAT